MRIGIVTYHQVINDGAVLQAHAQQRAIQKIFPQGRVEIIDFRYKVVERRERFDILKDVLKLRKSAFFKLRKFLTIRRFINSKLVLSEKRIVADDLNEISTYINDNYDAVVVGSDEVWKIDYKKFSRPFPNLYWLPEPINTIRIASAATANTLKIADIRKQDHRKIKELLANFDLVGVRDQFTFDFINTHVPDKIIHLMPDPTFALEFEEQIFEAAKKKLVAAGVDLAKPILGLSLSSNINELKALSSKLFSSGSELGYQIVSIGQYNEFCHFNLTARLDPLEWAHVYRFFNICITDRFHSTIFSIRNGVNFVSVDFSNRYVSNEKGKIHDLLSRVQLLDHHIHLKEIAVPEAIKKIMKIRQEHSNPAFSARLRQIDEQLASSYNNFMLNVKTLLTST